MTDELIIDLEAIQQLSQQRHDEFEVMRYMLEFREDISDVQIDTIVEEIAAPIVEAIDCTKCGNCCRSLDVYLTPADAKRLAEGIHIPLDTVKSRYIDQESAKAVDEWGKFHQCPCAFLEGKLCSVYEHRPETCRTYPVFTPDFRWTLTDLIEGAAICPIIYNVLSRMAAKTETL